MTLIPEFAPGCFGSALAYKSSEGVCLSCVFRVQCEPMHIANLAALRDTLGVKIAPVKGRPKVVDKAREALIARDPGALSISTKAQDLIARLDRNGIRIRESLATGTNPFVGKINFLAIMFHLITRLGRPVPRPLLISAFVTKLNWKHETAAAHVRIGFEALSHMGILDQNAEGIMLRKDVVVHHEI